MENSAINLTATLYEPHMLKYLVEKLARLQGDMGYSLKEVENGSRAIDTSTIESYVNGDLYFSDGDKLKNIQFITCFVFTCIKSKGRKYKFTWGSSLS